MEFSYFAIEDEETLRKVYGFRYEILCEELGFFEKNPQRLEQDPYDKYADQFLVLKECQIAATMRLIHHSPIGYPALFHLNIYPRYRYLLEEEHICEVSRVLIAKEYRNFKNAKEIIKHFITEQVYIRGKEYGVEWIVAAIEKRFWRLLRSFNVHFEPIGDIQSGYGSPRFPALLPLQRLESDNPHLKELYEKRRWYCISS